MRYRACGSVWGRWDLHFHTPASFDYENKAVTNVDIIAGLKGADVDVVAITDHHVINVDRIRELQTLAGNDLTVLPGIEFRTELGGREKVHLIGIFPEDVNLDDLWTKLSGQLGLTPEDVRRKGDKSIYVDFQKASKLIRELGGIVTTHAGGKSNSIENIGNAPFKMALKTDLARDCVDIYEVGKLSDCAVYEGKVFPSIGKHLPLIIGSDNHDIRHYSVKAICWIKGDPSFYTFQQLTSDPGRAFLGPLPEETVRVNQNPTKYISAIRFEKKPLSKLDETWFSGELELNPGLIAIIGNKGSGKTALAESIGLLGNCSSAHSFSFLNDSKFRQPRNNKAREFDATLTWRSGYPVKRSLADSTDENAPQDVSYIPQSYLETVCNEVNNLPGGEFDKELKSVIFSHVTEDKKLDKKSLDDLLEFQAEPIHQRLEALRTELTELNRNILELEQRNSQANRQMLLSMKAGKDRELAAHDALRPAEVMQPEVDEAQRAATADINEQITNVNRERDVLNEVVRAAEESQRSAASRIASANRLDKQLGNLKAAYASFLASISADCDVLGLAPHSLASVVVNDAPIAEAKVAAQQQAAAQFAIAGGSSAKAEELRREVDRLAQELDAPNSAYQLYLEEERLWREKRETLIGKPDKRESLAYYEQQINELNELPATLEKAYAARSSKVGEIFTQIQETVDLYRTLYHPVQEFIIKNQVASRKLSLEFDASIVPVDVEQAILSLVNRGRRGSFNGTEDGRRALRTLLNTANLQTASGVADFTNALMARFRADFRIVPPVRVNIEEQLRQGVEPLHLLDAIFGLEYLSPKYQLKWSGKSIEELSPGERGTLLLVFYLLIDRRDIPLIIDQPEDNLDNQTVYDILVECLREARKRRQVIIVTHNPNLAVVCDADQIIHSHINKQNKNKVTYTSGSLERDVTNSLSITVLEGTRPAFLQRDRKYHEAPM